MKIEQELIIFWGAPHCLKLADPVLVYLPFASFAP